MAIKPRVVVGSAVFIGALAAGGITLASAQTTTTTPNPTTPNTTSPGSSPTMPYGSTVPHDRANCPHMGGSSGSSGTNGSTSTAPNATSSV
ncbi:MAG: hypothetical protein JWL83_1884 [Actinomycetia bacterium]|nr:hypothetical protein [Actinomycetes bacterium]